MLARWVLILSGLGLLCVCIQAEETAQSRVKRQTGLTCKEGETKIYSPKILQPGITCVTLIAEAADNFKSAYTSECQRWMGTADEAYEVLGSYITVCRDISGGVEYEADICCEGVITGNRCFTCVNYTSDYTCNYETGTIETCNSDEICGTTHNFYHNYPSTRRLSNKGCISNTTCAELEANNTDTCQHYIPKPSCTSCCEGPFCNYEPRSRFMYVADSPCVTKSCYNGGTCVVVNGTAYCQCPEHYTGSDCYTCLPCHCNPCRNGGTCMEANNTSGYMCACPEGKYGGPTCSSCLPCYCNPCRYGGTCAVVNNTSGYNCTCTSDRYGSTCQYLKACPPGKYGTYCQYTVCDHGGWISHSTEPFYRCYCTTVGWTGQNCSELAVECAAGTTWCLNGGTCMDYGGGQLRCICPEEFIGELCERRVYVCFDPRSTYWYSSYQYHSPLTQFSNRNCSEWVDYDGLTYPSYGYCRSYMRPSGSPTSFVNGQHGYVSGIEANFIDRCERGAETNMSYGLYSYSNIYRKMCCPTCYSLPCQNGGWCIQKSNGDYLCQCRFGYEGRNCENQIDFCIVAGDPHQYQFDGGTVRFQGICKHCLARSTHTNATDFEIRMHNERRNGSQIVSYPKYFEMETLGHTIRLDKGKVVYVDGIIVYPDVTYPGFRITFNGRFVRLETSFGVVLEYDGVWTGVVKVPPQYKGNIECLCGNNDGNATNDVIINNPSDPIYDIWHDTGKYWQVFDPEEPNCTEGNSTLDACLQLDRIEGAEFCGPLNDTTVDGVFRACLLAIGDLAKAFFESCLFDVCASEENEKWMVESKCNSAQALATKCGSIGRNALWRSALNCSIDCPDGMEGFEQTSACTATCQNPDAPDECPWPMTENCVCVNNTILHEGKCMNPELCGCYDADGNHYEIGDTWLSSDCLERFSCDICQTCTLRVGTINKAVNICPTGTTCKTIANTTGECAACQSPGCTKCYVNGPGLCDHDGCTIAGYNYDAGSMMCAPECTTNMCRNGGTCNVLPSGNTCVCRRRFVGRRCQKSICSRGNYNTNNVALVADPTDCHCYFYCRKRRRSYSSSRHCCPGNRYFNQQISGCQVNPPAGC